MANSLRELLTIIANARDGVVVGTDHPEHRGRFSIGSPDGALIAAVSELCERAPELLADLPPKSLVSEAP